jgi:TolA-binding protein
MNSPTSAMILSQQNAANIQFLQQQMNDVLSLKGEFNNITNTINQMQQQMQAMMQQQSATFNQVSGGNKVVTISGT